MKLPFEKGTFAREMKERVSGVNLTLQFENLESSLYKVATICSGILSPELYERLCSVPEKGSDEAIARDYLQRALLHFGLFEHLPFLIARIGNDGVTVAKSDSETTLFKYQEDELKNKFITTGWFWMNELIRFLNEKEETFEEWKENPARKEIESIPVKMKDFARYVGVTDNYFLIVSRWILLEVWNDCVLSRAKEPTMTDMFLRAICYEVMGRSCLMLAYHLLPEPIRKDFDNEMSKTNKDKSETHIKERVAERFLGKAGSYWARVDIELARKQAKEQPESSGNHRVMRDTPQISKDDSFCF